MSEHSYHGATSHSSSWRIDPTTHHTMSECSYHGATSRSPTMKDRSDDPSRHEQTLLPRSYISLLTPWRIDPMTHRAMSKRSYHRATSHSSTTRNQSDDPSHHRIKTSVNLAHSPIYRLREVEIHWRRGVRVGRHDLWQYGWRRCLRVDEDVVLHIGYGGGVHHGIHCHHRPLRIVLLLLLLLWGS